MMWFWTVLSGAVTVALAAWTWFRVSNRHVLRMCTAIPRAHLCYPVLGNALALLGPMDKLARNLFQIVHEAVLKGQRAVCFWIGAYPIILVVDPDDIRKVLYNTSDRGNLAEECGKGFMDYGLLTSPVDHWKVTRPHLNSTFRPRNLEQLIPVFNRNSRQLVADLSRHNDGRVFNLLPHVMFAAIKSIGVFMYGEVMEYDTNVLHSVEIAAELMLVRVMKPWLRIYFIFKLLYEKEIKCIRTSCTTNSQLARANYNESRQSIDEDVGSKPVPGNVECNFQTILGSMRQLQKRAPRLSEEHIKDEMIGFWGAGTDTIGASVSSCLLALARFPQVQEKVYDEICAVVSEDEGEDIAYHDLKRLAYLDQVVKEALRMYPPAPFTTRVPAKDIDLGGYTLPANKTTILCLSAASMDAKYFPDPREFDPDRFSTANSPKERALMPFSKGPRDCIGKEYAKLLMKTMVAHVVRKYILSTDTDVRDVKKRFVLTVTSKDGYNVSLRSRSV